MSSSFPPKGGEGSTVCPSVLPYDYGDEEGENEARMRIEEKRQLNTSLIV